MEWQCICFDSANHWLLIPPVCRLLVILWAGTWHSVLCLLLTKTFGQCPFRSQALLYPVTDASMNTKSYRDFHDGPWLTKAAMKWFFDMYLSPEDNKSSPYVSPLRASLSQLAGLPPTLVITDENDVLRDEGEEFARKLMKAGVPTTSVRYNGLMHDFALLNSLENVPAVMNAKRQVADFLRFFNEQYRKISDVRSRGP